MSSNDWKFRLGIGRELALVSRMIVANGFAQLFSLNSMRPDMRKDVS